MATSVVNPRAQFFANNGRPLIGGRIHTYVAGSSTRAPTYKDAARAQPNTNPIILDGRGEAQIYLAEGVEYKFVIEDSKGALIYTQEPVYGAIWPDAASWPSDATLSYRYMLEAKAAAGAIGPIKFYDTYAQAVADSAGEKKLVEVSQDETCGGARTRYWAEAGTLTFSVNLDQLRMELSAADGAKKIGARWGGNLYEAIQYVTPEQFGAVGGDVAKDTAAFIAMLASGAWQFMPDPRKRYDIGANLDFGSMSDWKAPLSMRCLLSDTGQHDAFITAEGLHSFSGIDVSIPEGVVRRAVISDDFYGGEKPYRKEFRTEFLRINSVDIQAGYSGDGSSCVKLSNQDFIKIGENELSGYRKCINLENSKRVVVGWSVMSDWYRGLQTTNIKAMSWDGGQFHGATEDVSGEAGNNAFVCRGVVNGRFGDYFIHEPGEHGIRITARPDGGGGYFGGRLSFGNVVVYRPGKCGFKEHTGTGATERVVDLSIASLYVEDAGWEIYAPGKTPIEGANHFGLNLQTCDNVRIGSYVSRRKNGQFNGQNVLLIRDADTVNIGLLDGEGSYGPGIFANPGSSVRRDWQIKGKLTNCGNGTGVHAAILLLAANNIARARFDIDVFNCPSIYNLPAFSGSTAGPIIFEGYYDGISGALYQGVTSRNKVQANMRPFSWPLSGSTEYPLGTTLQALSNSDSVVSVGRELDVHVSAVSATRFVAVASGKNPVEAVSLKLAGIWVSVGRDVTTGVVLVRRTL